MVRGGLPRAACVSSMIKISKCGIYPPNNSAFMGAMTALCRQDVRKSINEARRLIILFSKARNDLEGYKVAVEIKRRIGYFRVDREIYRQVKEKSQI